MTQGGNGPLNPPSSPSTASLSGVARCWHSNANFSLFSSLFFFDQPSRFVQIPRDLSCATRSCGSLALLMRYSRSPLPGSRLVTSKTPLGTNRLIAGLMTTISTNLNLCDGIGPRLPWEDTAGGHLNSVDVILIGGHSRR